MIKALNANFKPKIVPVLNGLKAELLNNIQYPVCIQPIPHGIPFVMRSGYLTLFTGTPIKNLEFKNKLNLLIQYTRWLKLTIEGVIVSNSIKNEEFIISNLLQYTGDIDDLEVYITDFVFERTPEGIGYLVRARDMKNILHPGKIGKFPKVVEHNVANSRQEFVDYIVAYSVMGHKKFRIASPNSKYKFGEIEDLFSGDGGVADIDGTELYKGELKLITPRILNIRNKITYLADILTVKYFNQDIDIKLEDVSIIVAAKIWENREALLGSNVVFTGLIIPGYSYPKFRNFKRFEKQ